MYKLITILLFIASTHTVTAQKTKTFRSVEEAVQTPNEVYKLLLFNQKGYQIRKVYSELNKE